MATAVATKNAVPPAPFSALLRRSKFASHDPKISQIYASHGGDAHRGNFGFKRPIPLRRRQPYITVSEVDSRGSQTVWTNAEQPGQWIKMWDEVSVNVRPKLNSSWMQRLGSKAETTWLTDSDFARSAEDPPLPHWEDDAGMEAATKVNAEQEMDEVERLVKEAKEAGLFRPMQDLDNIHAMREKDFERYLARVRSLRPLFKRYLAAGEALARQGKPPRRIYEFSQYFHNVHKRFLGSQMHERYHAPDSDRIEQQPHLNGGLTYSSSTDFQDQHLRQPQPGRLVAHFNAQPVVSFAGMVTTLSRRNNNVQPLDWRDLAGTGDRDPARGVSRYKVHDSELWLAPRVVGGQSALLRDTKIRVRVEDVTAPAFEVANPFRPGSKEYITHKEGVDTVESRIYKAPDEPTVSPEESMEHSVNVMSTLKGLI